MRKREERIGLEIRRLDHMLARTLQARVKSAGLDEVTLMHGWIIRYLYENRDEDIFQKDIEQHFSIGRSTVTNIIQLMEKKGFVLRESVEHDARLKKVVLTKKGVLSHEMIENLIENLDMSLVEGITDEELSVFYSVVKQLTENLSRQDGNVKALGGETDAAGNRADIGEEENLPEEHTDRSNAVNTGTEKTHTGNREEEVNDPDYIA